MKYITSFKIIILALFLAVGISWVQAQWTGPTASFPDGNTERPINVGADLQAKSGSLWANFLGSDTGFFAQGNAEIGGTLTIGGGNPGIGKILTSQDTGGLATWNTISFSCTKRTASSLGTSVSRSCIPTEIVTGGGGTCTPGSLLSSKPLDLAEGWEVRCSQSTNVTVYAVCCDSQLEAGQPSGSI